MKIGKGEKTLLRLSTVTINHHFRLSVLSLTWLWQVCVYTRLHKDWELAIRGRTWWVFMKNR